METLPEIVVTEKQKSEKRNTIWLIFIALFLLILVSINIYDHVIAYQKSKIALELINTQGEIIAGLMDSYNSDAYENPSLERISEQQLIATEYTIMGLQILGMQNNQIIQLLASTP